MSRAAAGQSRAAAAGAAGAALVGCPVGLGAELMQETLMRRGQGPGGMFIACNLGHPCRRALNN